MVIAEAATLEYITCLCEEHNVRRGIRTQCSWQGDRFPGKIVAVHSVEPTTGGARGDRDEWRWWL